MEQLKNEQKEFAFKPKLVSKPVSHRLHSVNARKDIITEELDQLSHADYVNEQNHEHIEPVSKS